MCQSMSFRPSTLAIAARRPRKFGEPSRAQASSATSPESRERSVEPDLMSTMVTAAVLDGLVDQSPFSSYDSLSSDSDFSGGGGDFGGGGSSGDW